MVEIKSVFETLNSVDVSAKLKTKNNLTYLSWASAWAEVKKRYPDATYKICPQIGMDEAGNTRFWHDDGNSGWVEVEVIIGSEKTRETLPIMDFKNKAIPADQITSVDANKAVKRCLTKACALQGLGLYIYEGEDLPEDIAKINELKAKIKTIVDKKVKLSANAKEKVSELCKVAEKEASPELDDESITGNFMNIDDIEILEKLTKQLLAVRK